MSLRNSGTSQAMLRLMGDLKEIKTDPPEVIFYKIYKNFFF